MSENDLLNKIIETLEKAQNVQIWNAQKEISNETINKLKALVKEHTNSEINKHIVNTFGIKNQN